MPSESADQEPQEDDKQPAFAAAYERVENKLLRIGASKTGIRTKIAEKWKLGEIQVFLPDPDQDGNYDQDVLARIMGILEYYGIELLPLDYN